MHKGLHVAHFVSELQVEETPQVLMLRAQVALQERAMADAEAHIQAAMQRVLLLWWGLPTPGAAMQVNPHSLDCLRSAHLSDTYVES